MALRYARRVLSSPAPTLLRPRAPIGSAFGGPCLRLGPGPRLFSDSTEAGEAGEAGEGGMTVAEGAALEAKAAAEQAAAEELELSKGYVTAFLGSFKMGEHADKFEKGWGDLMTLKTRELKGMGIPCKHRKVILSYAERWKAADRRRQQFKQTQMLHGS